jgi:hypothetical protein
VERERFEYPEKILIIDQEGNRRTIDLDVIQMDIGGHPPFPTGSKQFSDNFGNLLFLAVLTSGAILRA